MNKFSKFKKASISKSEMKVVKGGGGTCAYLVDGEAVTGVSKETALIHFNHPKGASNWCCDSCHKATWL